MKYLMKYCLILFLFSSLSVFAQKEKNKTADQSKLFLDGQLTIKLKAGVGDYQKQKGSVSFGISSLDEKVEAFGIYQLDKRFNYNKRLVRADLPDLSRIYKLSYNSEYSLKEIVKAFSADPNVEYAEGIPYLTAAVVPDDSLYDECQHLPQIMAEEAWDIHKGEDGTEEVVIAIVDDGVNWNHEDLADNVWQNLAEDADGDGVTVELIDGEWVLDPDDIDGIDDDLNGFIDDLVGWNFMNEDGDPNPTASNNQHGTHCAGIACATTNNGRGVASISYNLKHMGVCMSAGADGGPYAFDGIIYAAESGADIISFSWGGWAYSEAHQEAIFYSQGLGSIIVASAMNTGIDAFYYPASYLGVISVANVLENDELNPGSSHNYAVDISAPGTDILSTVLDDDYEFWTGTSMSCPMISGSLGLLKSYHPEWTNEELMNQIIATADDISDVNEDYEHLFGSGRVNAYEMLLGENLEDPYLKLDMISLSPIDDNGNDIIEAGETVVINMDIRNFMQTYSADGAILTLTTSDPFINIIDGDGVGDIRADTIFSIIDQFEIQVAMDAEAHMAEFNLHIDADIDIVVGEDISFNLLVAPSGYFVFDGDSEGADYSGEYIYNYLIDNGFSAMYGSDHDFPSSLNGFDAVFLSFGNYGSGYTPFSDFHVEVVSSYLNDYEGDVYIEGGDVFGFNQADNAEFHALFGLASANDGSTNPIDSLWGLENSLANGIAFMSNTQVSNDWIDTYMPLDEAEGLVEEFQFGIVGVQNDVPDSYETVCFSYSIADLVDGDFPNTRDEFLHQILIFFDEALSIEEEKIDPFSINVYPNPSQNGTTIRYHLSQPSTLSIQIMNSQGQILAEQTNQMQTQGQHEFYWNAEDLPAGVYYYTLMSEDNKSNGKIMLMK